MLFQHKTLLFVMYILLFVHYYFNVNKKNVCVIITFYEFFDSEASG